ncbi:MAG: hypothetical protein K0R39_1014 [Symbiobacteriaceae bacterium]|jgi:hypothetical protein|nr:hypothetical protein [Symbiobacteriaceae bacterium]
MSDPTLPPARGDMDEEEVLILGPETVVALRQGPIPRPRPKASRKVSGKAQVPPPPAEPSATTELPPSPLGGRPMTPTSVAHSFYWPAQPASKGAIPYVYRAAFDTKNHPR